MSEPRTTSLVIGFRLRPNPNSAPTLTVQTVSISSSSPHRCGFSTLELVVAMGIILAISAIAIPTITKTVTGYQLNDAATQVAGILKFTRFEAIRRNTPIKCLNSEPVAGAQATVWSDNDGDGVVDPTEKQIILGSSATLVPPDAVPSTAALATAVGVDTLTAVNPAADGVKFDQRGAATPSAVYVFYVGNTATPENGFRAVIVLPSGSVQVWTYTGGASVWQQLT